MDSKQIFNDEEIKNFHIPRWSELPVIDLYLDQVINLLEKYLANYIPNENKKDGALITKTMINNYVKHNIIKPPVNKKYNREHLASLFVVFILKQIYSIGDIKKLIDLALETASPEHSYDRFCSELEKAIYSTFARESSVKSDKLSQEQYILRNVVQSFANKLYVQRVYLKN